MSDVGTIHDRLSDSLLHGIASCEGGPLELKNLRVENVRQWRRLCFSVIHFLQIHLAQQIGAAEPSR